MPKLDQIDTGFDDTMRNVLSSGVDAVTVGVKAELTNWELAFHHHAKAQVMLSVAGVALCEAEGSFWLVPPQTAIIIPAGLDHRIAVTGQIEGYAVFLIPQVANAPPARVTTVSINPLLRELIIRSAQFPVVQSPSATQAKITELLIDEVREAPTGGLHLPMPSNMRLRAVLHSMLTHPSDRGPVKFWSKQAGMSERTLARVIAAETGLSFSRWRERLNIILALQWMTTGLTVEETAFSLGYENAGSFVRMFHKAMGMPPARYIAQHRAG